MTTCFSKIRGLFLPVSLLAAFSAPLFVEQSTLARSSALRRTRAQAETGPGTLRLRRGPLKTAADGRVDTSRRDLARGATTALQRGSPNELRFVQFPGPIRRQWLERLKATGVRILGYVPNYAYLVHGKASAMARIAALDGQQSPNESRPISWMGDVEPADKLDPILVDDQANRSQPVVDVEIEFAESPELETSIQAIRALAVGDNEVGDSEEPRRFSSFAVLRAKVEFGRLLEIASFGDVLFIAPTPQFKLLDELSLQIIAGNLAPDATRPTGPGYMAWLSSKGLLFRGDFLVDITDTGLDRGSTEASLLHPDLLDAQGESRVAYNIDYVDDGFVDDRLGHGSLMTSIVAGLGSAGAPDAEGFRYGMGVDPAALVGASRIFDRLGRRPVDVSFTDVAQAAYLAGARLSNNSWGLTGNAYDISAQEFDSLTRDANPDALGNQEMTFVFAAGNNGAGGTINSPGVAKNVITVAASENYRPAGVDSCNLDGQGPIGPDGADNAMDILRYSSGGFTADLRAKPDITAPGTHIYGAASKSQFFFAQGLCPGTPVFQPPGQPFYTWSSGTSMAAPHVTGAGALVRKFFTSRNLLGDARAPSPAMIKAFLINSTSYMTGAFAGDTLPSQRQGWGLLNLSRALDEVQRSLIDQTHRFTESGQKFEIQGSLADRSRPLRITIAWTDAPGSLVAPALVNDLDLEVRIGDSTVYLGNNFAADTSITGENPDVLNNVESINIPASAFPEGFAGNFTITVRASNIAGDGVPGNPDALDQDFALVVSNLTDPVPKPPPGETPPIVSNAEFVKKRLTITGRDFNASARVEINGKLIERVFSFEPATNALSIKLKAKKLNLRTGQENQIVVIQGGNRSAPFTLLL